MEEINHGSSRFAVDDRGTRGVPSSPQVGVSHCLRRSTVGLGSRNNDEKRSPMADQHNRMSVHEPRKHRSIHTTPPLAERSLQLDKQSAHSARKVIDGARGRVWCRRCADHAENTSGMVLKNRCRGLPAQQQIRKMRHAEIRSWRMGMD